MTSPERFMVQILGPSDQAVGLGFVAGERHLLTCAHVVNVALGRGQREIKDPGAQWLSVEFPFAGGPGERVVRRAKVAAWLPNPDLAFDVRDVAGLVLTENLPEGAEVATLVSAERDLRIEPQMQFWGPVTSNRGKRLGGHVVGQLRGRTDRTRWQVDQEMRGTFRVQRGFSGGPVWEQRTGQVIGLVQAIPSDEDSAAVYVVDTELLVQAWPELLYRPPPCPYMGLAAFSEHETDRFFGRETFVDMLVQATRTEPVIAIIGPSGSGKTSVLAAGLVPALRREYAPEGRLSIGICRPGAHPLLHLAAGAATAAGLPAPVPAAELDAWLGRILAGGLAGAAEYVCAAAGTSQLLLIIDQLEQIFTECASEEHRTSFLAILNQLVREQPRQVQVALSLRADFFGELAFAEEPLGGYIQTHAHKLHPMSEYDIRRAITEPARIADRNKPILFDDGLVDLICEDFRGRPAELPLLEFALTRLWERQRGRTLTLKAYRDLGGVAATLTSYADQCFARLSPQERDAAQRIFAELVQPDRPDIARQTRRSDLRAGDWATVNLLRDQRLVAVRSPSGDRGAQIVEIAHEALLSWPRLRGWLDASKDFRAWKAATASARGLWQQHQRHSDLLLRGPVLARALEMTARYPDDVGELQDFIDASKLREEAEAQIPLRRADALSLARRCRAIFAKYDESRDMAVAITLAICSLERLPTVEGDTVLRKALADEAPGPLSNVASLERNLSHDGRVNAIAYSPRGTHLATASHDGTARIWDLATGAEIIRLAHEGRVLAVAYSPDGTRLATASDNHTPRYTGDYGIGTAHIWDLDTGTEIAKLIHDDSQVLAVAFSPDGTQLATATDGHPGTGRIWNPTTGTELMRLNHGRGVRALAYSPDGSRLATGPRSFDHAKIWDVTTGKETASFFGPSSLNPAVAFSPDGTQLAITDYQHIYVCDAATGRELIKFTRYMQTEEERFIAYNCDGSQIAATDLRHVRIWDLATRDEVTGLSHRAQVLAIAYSPDGTHLATGSADNLARIWDLAVDTEVTRVIYSRSRRLAVVAYSPDGTQLATGGADNLARIWDLATGTEVSQFSHDGQVLAVAYSPDGTQLATGGADNLARVWDLATGTEVSQFSHDGQVLAVAYSPDGTQLATGGADNLARVWDLATSKRIMHLSHGSKVKSVAYSPDGTQLATGGADNLARVWDLATGTETIRLDYKEGVKCLAFSPDGSRLATADGYYCRIEVIRTSALIQLALTKLTRNLSQEEWDQHLPEIQYRVLRADLT